MRKIPTEKIISAALAFVMVFGVCVNMFVYAPETEAAGISSFSDKVSYRWIWKNCKSMDDLAETGIFGTKISSCKSSEGKYNPINLNFNYTFVLVSGTTKKAYYYSELPGNGKEYLWNSGNALESPFDPSSSEFSSELQLSQAYLVYDSKISDTSASFRMFKADSGVLTYSGGTCSKNTSKGTVYGMYNNCWEDYEYEKNGIGEAFTFSFDSSKLNSTIGNVRVIETDNTSYHWSSYDNYQKYGETDSNYGDNEYFYLWVGYYGVCGGLDGGSTTDINYNVAADNILCDNYALAVIEKGAILTIEQGAAMTVKGKLYVEGEILNYGTVIIEKGGELIIGANKDSYGKMMNSDLLGHNGSIIIQSGGRLAVTSRLVVQDKKSIGYCFYYTMFSASSANFINNGTAVFNGGDLLYFDDCVFKNCKSGKIYIPYLSTANLEYFNAIYVDSGSCHSYTNNGSIYSGTVLLS